MKRLNLNKLASEICRREGGKLNLSVAQVKEVLRHTLDILAVEDLACVLLTLRSRKDKLVRGKRCSRS